MPEPSAEKGGAIGKVLYYPLYEGAYNVTACVPQPQPLLPNVVIRRDSKGLLRREGGGECAHGHYGN